MKPPTLTTERQLAKFIADSDGQLLTYSFNRWLSLDPTLEVYVRRSTRFINSEWITFLDLANVSADPQGAGRFTRFLEYVESVKPYQGVYIEQVHNKQFAKFFAKRDGYTRNLTTDPYQMDFMRLWDA